MFIKIAVACCLAAVVFGQGQQVCLPPTFQWQRSQNFNGNFNGFDLTQEWFDNPQRLYRTNRQTWVNGTQYFFETIVYGGQGKMWQLEGKQSGGSITCTYHTGMFPTPNPCLLANATVSPNPVFVGGDVPVLIYGENWMNRNITIYQEIGLVQAENIPVWSREAYSNHEWSQEMYFNWNINVNQGDFIVPSFCPQNEPSTAKIPLETFQQMWPQVMRRSAPVFGPKA